MMSSRDSVTRSRPEFLTTTQLESSHPSIRDAWVRILEAGLSPKKKRVNHNEKRETQGLEEQPEEQSGEQTAVILYGCSKFIFFPHYHRVKLAPAMMIPTQLQRYRTLSGTGRSKRLIKLLVGLMYSYRPMSTTVTAE
jgi:hypothetical protein